MVGSRGVASLSVFVVKRNGRNWWRGDVIGPDGSCSINATLTDCRGVKRTCRRPATTARSSLSRSAQAIHPANALRSACLRRQDDKTSSGSVGHHSAETTGMRSACRGSGEVNHCSPLPGPETLADTGPVTAALQHGLAPSRVGRPQILQPQPKDGLAADLPRPPAPPGRPPPLCEHTAFAKACHLPQDPDPARNPR